MNAEQKRAAVPVAIILGFAFAVGMILSFCLTNSQGAPPIVVGAIGPLMLIPDLMSSAPWYFIMAAGWAALFATGCYAEIARGKRGQAALAAFCLGILWVQGVFWVSILTNLS